MSGPRERFGAKASSPHLISADAERRGELMNEAVGCSLDGNSARPFTLYAGIEVNGGSTMLNLDIFSFVCEAVLAKQGLDDDTRHTILWAVTYSKFSLN